MSSPLAKDFFQLFGLPQTYAVDRAVLDTRYRALQREVHPDRFAHAGDLERRISVQQAAQLNEGYQTLKDPLLRGRYMLELRGHLFNDEHNTTRDTGFLVEQMELRERLETVREQSDPLEETASVMKHCKARLVELGEALGIVLAETDAVSDEAISLVLKMQFYRKLEQEAETLEMDLEDEYS